MTSYFESSDFLFLIIGLLFYLAFAFAIHLL